MLTSPTNSLLSQEENQGGVGVEHLSGILKVKQLFSELIKPLNVSPYNFHMDKQLIRFESNSYQQQSLPLTLSLSE